MVVCWGQVSQCVENNVSMSMIARAENTQNRNSTSSMFQTIHITKQPWHYPRHQPNQPTLQPVAVVCLRCWTVSFLILLSLPPKPWSFPSANVTIHHSHLKTVERFRNGLPVFPLPVRTRHRWHCYWILKGGWLIPNQSLKATNESKTQHFRQLPITKPRKTLCFMEKKGGCLWAIW